MTKQERFMYDILARISNSGAPIIFKGALITKLILSENEYSSVQRMTKDIDANWIGTPPSMNDLVETLNNAIGDLKNNFFVDVTREYGDKRSAGLCIREKVSGDKVISMDIDIKPSVGSRTYFIGEASINGVLVDEILSDKLSTLSNDAIYKHRAKDIIDVYSLAHCVKIRSTDIFDMCKKRNRKIQDFEAFYNKIPEIQHAYEKLYGIIGKPEFSEVYSYLDVFIQPFAKNQFDKLWLPEKLEWVEL